MTLEKDGKISPRELKRTPGVPSYSRLKKGACAVIECAQTIPCNPCVKACPSGAIKIKKSITNLPVLDVNKCSGCGTCIPSCPGLAIFVVDFNYNEKMARMSIPYEFLPVPQEGNGIVVLGRMGEELCTGKVHGIRKPAKCDHTIVVSFLVPKKYAMKARNIRTKSQDLGNR